jgi:phosphohistidine swiveling domain-containing protein
MNEVEVGAKALRLAELAEAGMPVPAFVVVPASVVAVVSEQTAEADQVLRELCAAIVAALPNMQYAVRSAALIEDGREHSFAGQFKTELAVEESGLRSAIRVVVAHAKTVPGFTGSLSIIVQRQISPQYAGVLFTRDVRGGTELVLEYRAGTGEAVVGGQSVTHVRFPFRAVSEYAKRLPFIVRLVDLAMLLETRYEWPQDIEWAYAEDGVQLLQTRPITTISEAAWHGIRYLEATLADKSQYYYEQTNLFETFGQPRPLSFSILQAFYAVDGPVSRAYRKVGVRYQATAQLQLFGNELFVDKQAELRSLFPSLGYLKHGKPLPSFERVSGLGTTLNNWFRLTGMSVKPRHELVKKVAELLVMELPSSDTLSTRWNRLLEHYEDIFIINLRAERSVFTLKRLLGADAAKLPTLLRTAESVATIPLNDSEYVGNSLSIDDTSPFSRFAGHPKGRQVLFDDSWLAALPDWKRRGLLPHIERACYYHTLREQGRWVSVRLITHLRNAVTAIGREYFGDDSDLVYFASIRQLLDNDLQKEQCLSRYKQFMANQALDLPSRVVSFVVPETSALSVRGLSPGTASGVLVNETMLTAESGPKILFTEVLSPDLTKYFSEVQGIVSKEGGLLSHLAIMAREAGLPVVTTKEQLLLGVQVHIDGAVGTIEVIDAPHSS